MANTVIPITAWTPDAGEFSPPNSGFLCVENIAPSAFGYDKQYVFARNSNRNPVFDVVYSASDRAVDYMFAVSDPEFHSVSTEEHYTDYVEWMFFGASSSIFLKKGSEAIDSVANSGSSQWIATARDDNGDASFTRFGPFVLASALSCPVHIFDMTAWTGAGTEDFVPITLPSGVPSFNAALIKAHKTNVFAADIIFASSFEGYTGHVPDMLLWTDDYSAENFGSPALTPHLAGNGFILLRDNHGPIRALCSADEVLYVFKEDAIYRIDGPPYNPQKIISGIGTIYKNTVFAVGPVVYFWSQYGPARLSGGQLELLGKEGGWGRLICGHDSFVPIAYTAYKHPYIEDEVVSGEKLTNVPCGAYDPKTGNAVFGIHGKVRKMQTNSASQYAGYLRQNIWNRRGLEAGTVAATSRNWCNVLVVVNETSGLASVNYPMNMHEAIDGLPDIYGFKCLVSRPTYNTIATAFKREQGYDTNPTDFIAVSIGSMTAEDTHYVTGGVVFANHLAATGYNPVCITSPFIRCPESASGTQWKINRIRPVFAHQSEFSFSYAPSGEDDAGEIIPVLYVHNSSGTMKKYIPIQSDGFNEEGWILVNRDVYSTSKCIEYEVYRESSGFSGEATGMPSHVPWLGKFVGFEIEYDIQRKRSL